LSQLQAEARLGLSRSGRRHPLLGLGLPVGEPVETRVERRQRARWHGVRQDEETVSLELGSVDDAVG
jgi:hypothetical protein